MKKILISIIAIFLLTSCSSYFEVRDAVRQAKRGDYVHSLERLASAIGDENYKYAIENFENFYPKAEYKYIEDVKKNKDNNLRNYTKGLRNILAIRDIYLGLPESTKKAMKIPAPSPEERVFLTTELAKCYYNLGQLQAHFTYPEKLRAYGLFKEAEYFNSNRDKNITSRYEKAKKDATGIFLLNIVDTTRNSVGKNLYSIAANEILKNPIFKVGNANNYNIEFYINLADFKYVPSQITSVSGTDTFDDYVPRLVEKRVVTTEYKDGKEIKTIEYVPTYEDVRVEYRCRYIKYTKDTYLSFDFGYDVREKNGNVIYSDRRNIKVSDSVNWKVYFPSDLIFAPSNINAPVSETEKFPLDKDELMEKARLQVEKDVLKVIENLSSNEVPIL